MIHFYSQHGGTGVFPYHTEIRVRIRHRVEDGYKLASNGEEIKEDLSLGEFLDRVFWGMDYESRNKKVEEAAYELASKFSRLHMSAIESLADVYDRAYSKLFRLGKLVLPQHTTQMSFEDRYRGFGDPVDYQRRSDYQRAMMQTSAYFTPTSSKIGSVVQEDPAVKKIKEEGLKRASEEKRKKKEDEDVYYLLTNPD